MQVKASNTSVRIARRYSSASSWAVWLLVEVPEYEAMQPAVPAASCHLMLPARSQHEGAYLTWRGVFTKLLMEWSADGMSPGCPTPGALSDGMRQDTGPPRMVPIRHGEPGAL